MACRGGAGEGLGGPDRIGDSGGAGTVGVSIVAGVSTVGEELATCPALDRHRSEVVSPDGRHGTRPGQREKVLGQFPAVLVAGLGGLRERSRDDVQHRVGYRWVHLTQGRRLLCDDLEDQGRDGLASKGLVSRHHLVENAPEREDVAATVQIGATRLLGAHVRRCAQ